MGGQPLEAMQCGRDVAQEKISGPSHNALLPMGFFVEVVMWGDSDETHDLDEFC